MYKREDLEPIIYALTLQDRAKNRHKWLSRGFKITNARPGFLFAYWDCRLSKGDEADLQMYREVLRRYQIYKNRTNPVVSSTNNSNTVKPPTASERAESFAKATARWVKSGMQIADESEIESRNKICFGCEYWDAKALKGTGRCKKCGCSTWAKVRLASESCPVGYWKSTI
jgi:hypothetical protein